MARCVGDSFRRAGLRFPWGGLFPGRAGGTTVISLDWIGACRFEVSILTRTASVCQPHRKSFPNPSLSASSSPSAASALSSNPTSLRRSVPAKRSAWMIAPPRSSAELDPEVAGGLELPGHLHPVRAGHYAGFGVAGEMICLEKCTARSRALDCQQTADRTERSALPGKPFSCPTFQSLRSPGLGPPIFASAAPSATASYGSLGRVGVTAQSPRNILVAAPASRR